MYSFYFFDWKTFSCPKSDENHTMWDSHKIRSKSYQGNHYSCREGLAKNWWILFPVGNENLPVILQKSCKKHSVWEKSWKIYNTCYQFEKLKIWLFSFSPHTMFFFQIFSVILSIMDCFWHFYSIFCSKCERIFGNVLLICIWNSISMKIWHNVKEKSSWNFPLNCHELKASDFPVCDFKVGYFQCTKVFPVLC